MSKYNDKGESQAIRGLAKYTDEIRDRFINLAISYNINIITGSMPYVKEDGLLYNVGFLCRRDGTYEMYEKMHVTPDEIKSWGLSGGKLLQTFDTDCAKVGVLICYDVEFPELSRLMADQGMQILFVPFLTDTQNAYSRVRVCYLASAWASVAGYAVILLLSYWIGQKEYPIHYDLKSLGLYVLLAAVLYVIGEQVPIPNIVLRLAFRTVLLLLFIAYIIKKDLPLSQIPVINRDRKSVV